MYVSYTSVNFPALLLPLCRVAKPGAPGSGFVQVLPSRAQILITGNEEKDQDHCNLGRKKSRNWIHYFQVIEGGAQSFIEMQRVAILPGAARPMACSLRRENIWVSKK